MISNNNVFKVKDKLLESTVVQMLTDLNRPVNVSIARFTEDLIEKFSRTDTATRYKFMLS